MEAARLSALLTVNKVRPVRPIHGHVFARSDQQLMGNHAQFVVAHHLQRGFAFRQRVVEGDLFVRQALFFTTFACGADVLCELD